MGKTKKAAKQEQPNLTAEAIISAVDEKPCVDADKLKEAAVEAYKASGSMVEAQNAILGLIAGSAEGESFAFDVDKNGRKVTFARCADGSWSETCTVDGKVKYTKEHVPCIAVAERIVKIAIDTYWD